MENVNYKLKDNNITLIDDNKKLYSKLNSIENDNSNW